MLNKQSVTIRKGETKPQGNYTPWGFSSRKTPMFRFVDLDFRQYIFSTPNPQKRYKKDVNILCGFNESFFKPKEENSRLVGWEFDEKNFIVNLWVVFFTDKSRNKRNPDGIHYRKVFSIDLNVVDKVRFLSCLFTDKGVTIKMDYTEKGKGDKEILKTEYVRYTNVTSRRKRLVYPSLVNKAGKDWKFNFLYKF